MCQCHLLPKRTLNVPCAPVCRITYENVLNFAACPQEKESTLLSVQTCATGVLTNITLHHVSGTIIVRRVIATGIIQCCAIIILVILSTRPDAITYPLVTSLAREPLLLAWAGVNTIMRNTPVTPPLKLLILLIARSHIDPTPLLKQDDHIDLLLPLVEMATMVITSIMVIFPVIIPEIVYPILVIPPVVVILLLPDLVTIILPNN